MTLPELAAALEPITNEALASHDPDVVKASIVLAALMGAIDGGIDTEAFTALWVMAKLVCDHRSGRHDV